MDKRPKTPCNFVSYCATLIPTVFDDSMSYYEALCHLVAIVQSNSEITNQYIDKVNELDKYVKTYFDDLNIQAEVDHKLDEMVEAGTLQEIMGAYLNASAVWGFDTVADMKSATNLINGSYAKTVGYYAKNDGGGAVYRIRDIASEDITNEMTLLAIGDALVAELIIEDEINVLQCGLYADGETDNATLMTNLLAIVPEHSTLYFPAGSYQFNSTVTFTKEVNIHSDGTLVSNNARPMFLLEHLKNCKFEIAEIVEKTEQTFSYTDGANNNCAIVLQNCLYINLKVKRIYKFVIGVMLLGVEGDEGGCYYNTIEVNHIESCFHGIILLALAGGYINANTFNNIVYDYHTWQTSETPYFIQIKNGVGNTYYNNANNFYKLQAEYGMTVTGGPKLLYIKNGQSNYFEFDRVEIASSSNQELFVFTPTYARCNQVLVKYMTTSMTYTLTSDVNVVTFPLQYGVTNHQNNVKNITSALTLAENVSIAQGSVFMDYSRQVCYVNLVLQTSGAISANTAMVTGLPTPIEHVMTYERVASSTNLYVNPDADTVLYITRSSAPSTIVNRTYIASGSTITVNLTYKTSTW